jgi:outer membrane usher protein
VGLLIVATSSPALADESPAAAASPKPDTRTFATFVVNSEVRGEHIVLLKADGVYAAIEDLVAAGLVVPERSKREAVRAYVRLDELAPEIRAVFDPQGPTVRLDAQSSGSLTRDSNISVLPGQDWTGDALRDKSGYLNYSASLGTGATWSTAEQLTLSDSSKTLNLAGSLGSSGFQGGLSNVTWDDDVRRHIVTVGDVIGDSGNLGSSQTIEGVSIARSYGSTPYAQTITSPTLSGTALTPSVADVYVNGQLIRSVNVPPGAFNFSNLPAAGGANDAQIVLHDAFGHTQILSSRYYGGNAILRAGDTDYSYSIGEANSTGMFGPSYTGIAALGRYAVGLTRATTMGGHAELSSGFENAGASVAHAGSLGIVNVAIAESRDRTLSGLAGTAGYTFSTARIWATASVQATTGNYETLAQRSLLDATPIEKLIDVGLRPFTGSYTSSIAYSDSRSAPAGFTRQLSWQHSLPVGRGASLLMSTGLSESSGRSHPALSVFLIRSGGRNARDTTTLSLQGNGEALQPALEMQHATPIAGGSGYDATFYPSGSLASSGRYSLRSPDGNLDVDYGLARDGSLSGDAAVSGAIAFAGGYAHLSQPIADGFALVKVDGGEPVDVLIDHQDYGTTDAKGFLVLPNLQSYFAEHIGVESDAGPVNLDISSNDRNMVVAARRGVVVEFNASVVTAVIGKLVVSQQGRRTIPAFGQLSLKSPKGNVTSELDAEGRFYLEGILPGTYAATIQYAGGECRFTLGVPRVTTIEENIGSFTCEGS